jgi:solute carrier family 39 (zinc transporter), member 1/2/3
VSFAIVLLGILMLIALEQIAIMAMASMSKPASAHTVSRNYKKETELINVVHDHGHDHTSHNDQKVEHQHDHTCSCDLSQEAFVQPTDHTHHGHGDHTHAHSMHLIVDSNHRRAFIKAMIMEASIATHSIIIGFALGSYTATEVSTIEALMIAYAFHQFFEGISLGVVVSMAKFQVLPSTVLALIFALTVPVGIIIGITTTSSAEGDIVRDIANAFAAGSLLYNGLIEMAAEDFADPQLAKKPSLKLSMIVAMFAGAFCMALLAYWA